LVSVILPVFNGERFIGRAVEQVLAQSYRPLELIVVDDGSTDRTADVLRDVGNEVRVLKQVNQGAYAARNLGLANARGELIAFLDADDAWLPDSLDRRVALFEGRAQLGIAFGDATIVDAAGVQSQVTPTRFSIVPPARGRVFPQLIQENFIPTSSALVRRRCFEELGPFRPVRLAADYHKWLQISLQYEVDYVPEAVSIYTVHDGNISADRANQIKSLAQLMEDLRSSVQLAPGYDALIERRIVDLEYQWASIQVKEGLVRMLRTSLEPGRPVAMHTRLAALARLVGSSVRAKIGRARRGRLFVK
jgi:glycosyltransferase involved in cell wall biosynthesis